MKNLAKILCFLALGILIAGCTMPSLPEFSSSSASKENVNLPTISSFNTISEMTQIAFEWERVNDENVAGYYLYRAKSGEKLAKVATIKDRFSTHFVDTGLEPNTSYNYAMATYDKNGASSALGTTYTLQTATAIKSVEFTQVISNLPGRAKIIWAPHDDARVASYEIEKSSDNANWSKIAEVKGRLSAEYIDDNLKPNENNFYRVRAKTSDGVKSEPSQAAAATTKALPQGIENLSATSDQPKKIVLTWQGTTSDDFKQYNIYSSRASFLPAMKIASTQDTKYEDLINDNGAQRYYKVSVVDKDGQESPLADDFVEGSTLAAPNAPVISFAGAVSGGVELAWSGQSRAVKYIIYRSSKAGDAKYESVENRFLDTNVASGNSYKYEISAVDSYGLESDTSSSVKIEVK